MDKHHDSNEPPTPVEFRLSRIEWMLGVLVMVAILQTGLLLIIVTTQFVPSTFKLLLCGLLLVVFVIVFRKQIPVWIGKLARFVFSHMEQ